MVDIDRSVKNYYDQAQLSNEQLQKLVAMQDETGVSQQADSSMPTGTKNSSKAWFGSAVAASIVMMLALLFVMNLGKESVAERVAQEVAMNHNKALAVEYHADSYAALSQDMTKLDFTLLAPHTRLEQALTLVGGRYCSIQGQLAAQIKLADSSGRVYTLYQTRASEPLKSINTDRLKLDEVDIRLWEERGVLFALAEAVE